MTNGDLEGCQEPEVADVSRLQAWPTQTQRLCDGNMEYVHIVSKGGGFSSICHETIVSVKNTHSCSKALWI